MRLNKTCQAAAWSMFAALLAASALNANAQGGITVYQYRNVPTDKVDEFVKRETTYWSEVAKKAIDKGNLTLWLLLEQVGGHDLANSSKFLFVNTYNDVDAAGSVWSDTAVAAAFPGVPMAKIETGSLSTTTSVFFLHSECWAAKDSSAKYVKLNYITSSNPGALIELERKHWQPFITAAMEANRTTQVAWGNARILSPLAENIKANTVSYDLFPSLKEALNPTWDPKTVFPNDGLAEINKLELNRRGESVYRIVKMVSK